MNRVASVAALALAGGRQAIGVKVRAANTSACGCLNFKKTYEDPDLAYCGMGFELGRGASLNYPKTAKDFISSMANWARMEKFKYDLPFCKAGFERLDDNVCVRVSTDMAPDKWYGKHWCYVSPDCPLQDEVVLQPKKKTARVKLCKEGEDKILGEMAPEKVIQWGRKFGVSLPGFLVKLAYPFERDLEFKDFMLNVANFTALGAMNTPIVVDVFHLLEEGKLSMQEVSDKVILMGQKLYTVPHTYDGFKCAQGCENTTSA